jgi:hypothetical protein
VSTNTSADLRVQPRQKRPVLVWIITGVYAIGALGAVASMYAALSGAVPIPPQTAEFYASFRTLNFAGLAISVLLAVTSMIQLFRLRRSAAYFITAGFGFGLLKQWWYWQDLAQLGRGIAIPLISQIIGLLIVMYAWRLLRVGVLR